MLWNALGSGTDIINSFTWNSKISVILPWKQFLIVKHGLSSPAYLTHRVFPVHILELFYITALNVKLTV